MAYLTIGSFCWIESQQGLFGLVCRVIRRQDVGFRQQGNVFIFPPKIPINERDLLGQSQ